jgi:ADP-ribosylation factor-like protein 6
MLIESIMTDEVIQKMQQPFFFLFNKQDKENTYDKDELIKDLGLDSKKYKNK